MLSHRKTSRQLHAHKTPNRHFRIVSNPNIKAHRSIPASNSRRPPTQSLHHCNKAFTSSSPQQFFNSKLAFALPVTTFAMKRQFSSSTSSLDGSLVLVQESSPKKTRRRRSVSDQPKTSLDDDVVALANSTLTEKKNTVKKTKSSKPAKSPATSLTSVSTDTTSKTEKTAQTQAVTGVTYCTIIPAMTPQDRRELHQKYHDTQYGFPIHDDNELFGRLLLEMNQCGLSWEIILKKQDAFRIAYDNFDIQRIAAYTDQDVERLMANEGICRNRLKIKAATFNAIKIIQFQEEFGSFEAWLDHHHPLSVEDWVKLFKQSKLKFVGTQVVTEFLQSTGYLHPVHTTSCPIYDKIIKQNPKWLQTEMSELSDKK